MYLLLGVLCLSAATLMFAIALLGGRNPIRPFWAAEGIITYALLLIIGLFAMGCMYIFKSLLLEFPPGLLEVGYTAAVLTIAVIVFMKMKVRQRLKAFAAKSQSSQILPFDIEASNRKKQPATAHSDYSKAA